MNESDTSWGAEVRMEKSSSNFACNKPMGFALNIANAHKWKTIRNYYRWVRENTNQSKTDDTLPTLIITSSAGAFSSRRANSSVREEQKVKLKAQNGFYRGKQIGKLGHSGFRNIQVEGESDKELQNHTRNEEMDCSLFPKRNVAPKDTSTS